MIRIITDAQYVFIFWIAFFKDAYCTFVLIKVFYIKIGNSIGTYFIKLQRIICVHYFHLLHRYSI